VYGVSTILGRFLTFLLTPLYANILPPDELGVVATVYAYVAFLNVIFGYGMESAYMKYRSTLELGNEQQTFSVPFISILVTSLVGSAFLSWQAVPVAGLIHVSFTYESSIRYAAWILCLDAVAVVPFAALRMERKAKRFAAVKLANIIVNVVCNIIFLVRFRMGVEGIFLSGVVSSALTLVLLAPTIFRSITFVWVRKLYRALLQFGLPSVPAGIAAMMIQVVDRPILEALTDKATVGIYQANYRLGIFMMLIVSMVDFAWRPFFLSHAKDIDAKPLFARILTYGILLMVGIFLLLSFFLEDVVTIPIFQGRSILPPSYWKGLPIVPVVLLAYVFLGISNNIVAGIYIEKKTKHLPVVTFIGAGINVAANYLLIPVMGMMGAAIATLLSYALMTIVLYFIVQGFYPVRYEFERIAKIGIAAIVVFSLFAYIKPASFEVVWKCTLLLVFGILMYGMKFFQPSELKRVAGLFSRGERGSRHTEPPQDLGS
jgi:O-antigen/teichoic acid export membrane protein